MSFATKAGFGGGLVIDYPNSKKAKKFYLVLWVGGEMMDGGGKQTVPMAKRAEHEEAMEEVENDEKGKGKVRWESKRNEAVKGQKGKKKRGKKVTGKEWIMGKKELYRKRGKEVSWWKSVDKKKDGIWCDEDLLGVDSLSLSLFPIS